MDPHEQAVLDMLQTIMDERQLTQRELAQKLIAITHDESWIQQKVWKVLHGKVELTFDILVQWSFAFEIPLLTLLHRALHTPPTRGYQAMTCEPHELRLDEQERD